MTVQFKELAGYPIESHDKSGSSAERRLLVAWEDRRELLTELMGNGYEFGNNNRAEYPDLRKVRVTNAQIKPFPSTPEHQACFDDITSDINNYSGKFAELSVSYSMHDNASDEDAPDHESGTFLTYNMNFAGEYAVIPGGGFFVWSDHPAVPIPKDANPTVRIPIVEHKFTWTSVLKPPFKQIRDAVGTVNNAKFFGAIAETLLFEGATAEREYKQINDFDEPQFAWRLTYVFREKQIKIFHDPGAPKVGWNHVWRNKVNAGDPGGWAKLVDEFGKGMYDVSDFNKLFFHEDEPDQEPDKVVEI